MAPVITARAVNSRITTLSGIKGSKLLGARGEGIFFGRTFVEAAVSNRPVTGLQTRLALPPFQPFPEFTAAPFGQRTFGRPCLQRRNGNQPGRHEIDHSA